MAALLSVVVPVHDVARYLDDCLRSLARQTHPELDVVLVDDGSTDGSAHIAAGWARSNPRFRLVSQENRGLGAARNAGIDLARGDYLAFLDSDDLLAPYAYEVLVGALEQTGSDFASGNVALLTAGGLRQSALHRGTHRVTRLGSDLARQPFLVYDRLACNKVFRRSFWERHGLRFPEGVRYEDIPVTVPAYALARTVDVIDLPVYYWRQREPGEERSLSQRRADLRSLVDRFAAVDSASRRLAELGELATKDWYDQTVLQSDLRMFLDLLPDVNDHYRHRFLDLAGDFLGRVDGRVLARLVPRLRLAWQLTRLRRLPELLTVVCAGSPVPLVRRRGSYYENLPYLDARLPGVDRELYRAPRGIRTGVTQMSWHRGRLRLTGYVYAQPAGAPRPWSSLRLVWLRQHGARRMLPLPTRPRRSPDPPAGRAAAWAGFQVAIRPGALRARAGPGDETWTVVAATAGSGGYGRRIIRAAEVPAALPARYVSEDVRLVPVIRDGALRLDLRPVGARVDDCAVDPNGLTLRGTLPAPAAGQRVRQVTIRLCRVPGIAWRCYPAVLSGSAGRIDFAARIPLADLRADLPTDLRADLRADLCAHPAGGPPIGEVAGEWLVEFAAGSGTSAVALAVGPYFVDRHVPVDDLLVLAEQGDEGILWLRVRASGPLVTSAAPVRGGLLLGGVLPPADPAYRNGLPVVLRPRDEPDDREPVADRRLVAATRNGTWRLRLRADALPPGEWVLLHGTDPGTVDPPLRELAVALHVRQSLPWWPPARRLRLAAAPQRRVVVQALAP